MKKPNEPTVMNRRWCPECGDLGDCTFPGINGRWETHRGDCTSRSIPIATICNPPEPTVIDESDLAFGMLATIRSEFSGFTCIGQAAALYVDTDGSVGGPSSWLFDDDSSIDDVVRGEAASMEDFR